ncbi:MAG: ATP-binding protein [Candidatus Jorgensenbacteria bacterium]|nr:ATP-binding protein [Candidatus Jorgensenbacteria bacterium]
MKNKTKISIVFAISLIVSILAGVFIFITVIQTNANTLKLEIISDIRTHIFERANLLDAYLLHPDDSSREKWISSSKDIDVLVMSMKTNFVAPDELQSVGLIDEHNNSIKQIGGDLFLNLPTVLSDPQKTHEIEVKLVNQLVEHRSEMANQATILGSLIRSKTSAVQIRLNISIGLLIFVLFIIIITNVTWIRKIIENIEEASAKDEATLSSIGDGVIAVDESGNIITVNKAAEEMLGLQFGDARGKSLFEVVQSFDENGIRIPIEKRPTQVTLATATATATFYARKDGTHFPVAINKRPIILDGKVVGAIDVFRDITKEIEIDRAKTEFISLASHQLRTPPTSMKWFLEMLISGEVGELNEKQKEYFDEVYKNNQRMITLINALLNMSRIGLGTFSIKPETVDIPRLSKEIIQGLYPQIQEKKQHISEKYSENLSSVVVDLELMRIVIQNIVSNAIKYTQPKGEIGIEIFLKQKGDEFENKIIKEVSLALTISDNGYGIPEDQKDKIFGKLFRAYNVKEMDTDGTGLGLYLVKSVIEHTKGEIWFQSELNKGTAFHVVIPLSGMVEKVGTTRLGIVSES